MNSSGNKNQEWDKFLGKIAGEVDGLITYSDNLNEFQRQIRPFAEKWKNHISDSKEYGRTRIEHWQKVKSNPKWQDKKAGPPEEGWEWDRNYLFFMDFDIGPIYEMPASYAPAVMAKIEELIEKINNEMQQYSPNTTEYRNRQQAIADHQQHLKDILSQFDKLPKKNEGWISTAVPLNRPVQGPWIQFLWFRYTDLSDEEVFGVWRPPLKKIRPDPIQSLIPEEGKQSLPPAENQEHEYERYYLVLTSIHDNMLPGVQSISKGIWPTELADSVWFRFTGGQPYGPDRPFIEVALERVKVDLFEKDEGERKSQRGKFGFHSKRSSESLIE